MDASQREQEHEASMRQPPSFAPPETLGQAPHKPYAISQTIIPVDTTSNISPEVPQSADGSERFVQTVQNVSNHGTVETGTPRLATEAGGESPAGGLHTPSSAGTNAGARIIQRGLASTFPSNNDIKMANAKPPSAPGPSGRGRPIGRPRGSKSRGTTRASTRGGRGGKRKRTDEDDDDNSSGSEIITPTAHTTKSGRNVQKPTTFVPPPQPSPQATPVYKKKKPTYRKNPESAVCKVCLRGVSPASNMIVFCDGCNTPYHQWCHQPPIDKSVIEEIDKEWFCRPCERERIQPVPEAEVLGFVAAAGASAGERQKYFSSLPPGLLVTLLTRATTLKPDLPVFDPTFQPKSITSVTLGQLPATEDSSVPHMKLSSAPHTATSFMLANSTPSAQLPAMLNPPPPTTTIIRDMESSEDGYGSDEHPSHYPRPGHGLMSTLPPESEDLHYLVDDESSRGVFTHLYQVEPQATSAGVEQ